MQDFVPAKSQPIIGYLRLSSRLPECACSLPPVRNNKIRIVFKVYFTCMGILFTCMPVYHVGVWGSLLPEICTGFPVTGVRDCCELPHRFWRCYQGPLEEQPAFVNTEPSLQPLSLNVLNRWALGGLCHLGICNWRKLSKRLVRGLCW